MLNPRLLDPKGAEQYIVDHTGRGTRWKDIHKTLLHLPRVARPAHRICSLHAILAVEEADDKGWFDLHVEHRWYFVYIHCVGYVDV